MFFSPVFELLTSTVHVYTYNHFAQNKKSDEINVGVHFCDLTHRLWGVSILNQEIFI